MSKILLSRNFIQKILKSLRDFFLRFPLRANFFLLSIATVWIYLSVHKNYSSDISLFTSILFVLLKVLLILAVLIFTISLLTTLIPYLIYLHRSRLPGCEPVIRFQYSEKNNESESVILSVKDNTAHRPLFGALKVVLLYDNDYHTFKFKLWKNKDNRNMLSRRGASGKYILQLPEIKNYQLHNIIFFFEDMFHLFSFSNMKQLSGYFSILPQQQNEFIIPVQPRHAKDTIMRTDTTRKQEGEWLHFKNFEPSDDVRRIVWTIYARNKELVVRLPEMQNIYASQVGFYSSFYNMLGKELTGSHMNSVFLNYYKNYIWSLFSSLLPNKEIELKYIPDQMIKLVSSPEVNEVMYEISASEWHADKKVNEYFNPLDVSVLCISSLIPASDLEQVARNATPSTVIVFIELSKAFRIKGTGDALHQLFFEPNEKNGKVNKWKWLRSPLRPIITHNERKIKELFQSSDATFYNI